MEKSRKVRFLKFGTDQTVKLELLHKVGSECNWTHGLIAQSVRASERDSMVVGLNPLRPTCYSYFKESFGCEYHIYITGTFVYMAHHSILLRLNPFDLRVDREGWWVYLSAEGAKNFSWSWQSLLWGWGSLTMTFTGKFVYMAHHFVLLRLSPFDLRDDREGWWFEHSVL